MKWSLYIGKISGIKIYLHWSFLFFIGWIFVSNLRAGGPAAFYAVLFIVSIFACVTLHELGHALTAKRLKYETRDITLLPIGGIARMREIPENPAHELLVAIAGPIVNFIIAGILAPFVFIDGVNVSGFITQPETVKGFLFNLFMVNITLGLFNLLPAFPMDGGRIFRAVLTMINKDRIKSTNIAVIVGQVTAVGFFMIGLFSNPILAIIGVFIFIAAHSENEMVKSKSLLHNFSVKDVVIRKFFSLDKADKINDAVKLLLDVQATDFIVMDNEKIAGTLSRNEIITALASKGGDSEVKDAMNTKVVYLKPDMPLEEIYPEIISNGTTVMPVVDDGKLIGVVDSNNILELILVKAAEKKSMAA